MARPRSYQPRESGKYIVKMKELNPGNNNILKKFISSIEETIPQIKAEEVDLNNFIIIDIREKTELGNGIIPNSYVVKRGFLEMELPRIINGSSKEVIIYCQSGIRSLLAVKSLLDIGYQKIYSLVGGISDWEHKKLPKMAYITLTDQEEERYKRHISLPEIGSQGQFKLKKSKILVIGAGGLGSSCLQYLCAAGVGTIGIVDNDVVEWSNLQRQVIHNEQFIGKNKVISANNFLTNLNSSIEIKEYNLKIDLDNAENIIKNYDLVIDCTDNFQTRYLINKVIVKLNKPLIHGSVYKFEGNVAVFNYNNSACYQCLYSEAPPKENSPNCSDIGVLGIVPGTIGMLQANEALKIILSQGTLLTNQILNINLLSLTFRKLNFSKRKECFCNI